MFGSWAEYTPEAAIIRVETKCFLLPRRERQPNSAPKPRLVEDRSWAGGFELNPECYGGLKEDQEVDETALLRDRRLGSFLGTPEECRGYLLLAYSELSSLVVENNTEMSTGLRQTRGDNKVQVRCEKMEDSRAEEH